MRYKLIATKIQLIFLKRMFESQVSYLDTGLASTYFSDSDQLAVPQSRSPTNLTPSTTPHKTTRRYKTQLRDFLSTCRSKRKLQHQQTPVGQVKDQIYVLKMYED